MTTNSSKFNIAFPIICIYEGRVELIQRYDQVSKAKKTRIPAMKNSKNVILDCYGNECRIVNITSKGYINPFFGFSLGHAGFGVCHLHIEYEKINTLKVEELKSIGQKIVRLNEELYTDMDVNVERWVSEFENAVNEEDVLRFIFYLANPLFYNNPGVVDINWRKRSYSVR